MAYHSAAQCSRQPHKGQALQGSGREPYAHRNELQVAVLCGPEGIRVLDGTEPRLTAIAEHQVRRAGPGALDAGYEIGVQA